MDFSKADLLATLVRIGNIFNKEKNLDRLLDTIVHETVRILNAERGTIFLLEGNEMWSKIATGLGQGEIIRINKHEGVVGSVVQTGLPLIIQEAYSDPRFKPAVDRKTGYRTRNILCVPLTSGQGNIIGAFELLNKTNGSFTESDLEILTTVGTQAAIAIENVRLYQQVLQSKTSLQEENQTLKQQLEGKVMAPTLVGDSVPMQQVKAVIAKVATTDANVLITGESGTGKELVARTIHFLSRRVDKPFVPLNCAALPDSLLESELFGIEKGVATGVSRRAGYVEQANGGTLFLDEVGEMPLSTQVKLLRVLQERTFKRIGGDQELTVDIRVIGATNRDLKKAIQSGIFREDLFYRLNVFPVHLPPLRERSEDIPILARFILSQVEKRIGQGKKRFDQASLEAMQHYPWPGNVREMENAIERAVILSEGENVELWRLLDGVEPPCIASIEALPTEDACLESPGEMDMKEAISRVEEDMIRQALARTGGNQLQAAKLLGISREGLRQKMSRYQL